MNTLRENVTRLEAARDPQIQIKILQRINDLLLTQYCIKIQENLHVYPLWTEAYYYHPTHFPDPNTHRVPQQKGRFGQLYFHTKGWGGVDLCLSQGDYCLCFLLKYSRSEAGFHGQIALRRLLEEFRPRLADQVALAPIPPQEADGLPIYHMARKGLKPGLFSEERLAAVKGIDEYKYSYPKGYGKTRLRAEGPAVII